jgi:nucleotide-binding universal stress UspA family protein
MVARVVVGYDGSPAAGVAVDWAARTASRRGIPLEVVYADLPGLASGPVGAYAGIPASGDEMSRLVADDGAARARKLVRDVEVTSRVAVGGAAGALVEASRQASLVVVGNRGHGPLAGALLGSVAYAVTSHAHCPVVVVRGDGIAEPGPDRPVVVGVDGSQGTSAALRFAAGTAAALRAPLTALSAWTPARSDPWAQEYWALTDAEAQVDLRPVARRACEQVVADAVAEASAFRPALTVRGVVTEAAPAVALADASRAAALLVVGARGHGGFAGLLLGSVSHTVIHAAACPVAVVRA